VSAIHGTVSNRDDVPSAAKKENNAKPRKDESSSSEIIESEAARGFALILFLSLSLSYVPLSATGST